MSKLGVAQHPGTAHRVPDAVLRSLGAVRIAGTQVP
jgi:hypothetical protein